jgi:antitoxin VapB
MRKDGETLVIEPIKRDGLLAYLETAEPLDEEFPDIDDPPPEPVEL